MTSFDERKKAFEDKFAHDESLKFKAAARANRMLGEWAAGIMGLEEGEVDEYVRSVIKADFEEAGSEDVFRKLHADIGEKVSEEEIRSRIESSLEQAIARLMDEE